MQCNLTGLSHSLHRLLSAHCNYLKIWLMLRTSSFLTQPTNLAALHWQLHKGSNREWEGFSSQCSQQRHHSQQQNFFWAIFLAKMTQMEQSAWCWAHSTASTTNQHGHKARTARLWGASIQHHSLGVKERFKTLGKILKQVIHWEEIWKSIRYKQWI